MSQYVGRYGQTEIFYFDFYSIALSKIDRANTRDLQDVQLLVQRGIIMLQELNIAFQDVLAQAQSSQGRARYPRFDPNAFATSALSTFIRHFFAARLSLEKVSNEG